MSRSRRVAVGAAACLSALALGAASFGGRPDDPIEDEPIRYSASTPTDAAADINRNIASGKLKLAHDEKFGYLPALLKAFKIPISSQMLVFSKTSFQRDLISPQNPRAIYFGPGAYVGYVLGGSVLEIATTDPKLGAVFYVLSQDRTSKPRLYRQNHECLQCHASSMTQGIPGHIVRSVYPRPDGQPDFRAGSFITTDRSPMRERWGGWYVTGTHGLQRHMGNSVARGAEAPEPEDLQGSPNLADLSKLINTSRYLGRYSDIVALMVAEHQTNLENLIIKAGYETRRALDYEARLNVELKRPNGFRSESTQSRIASVVEPLVRAMLFSGEAALTDKVTGFSGFASDFSAGGIRDSRGRSLRDLDLSRRLMKHPCSYTIYSPGFDQLPSEAKSIAYRRIWEVVEGKEKGKEFAHLSEGDKTAIKEILLATKPEFAAVIH